MVGTAAARGLSAAGRAPCPSPDDEQPRVPKTLLQRVADGEADAVKGCLDRFGGLVWSLARRSSPSRSDAEDAVQEIFLDLWKSAPRFDPSQAAEATFVAMIARRRLIDRQRSRQRRLDTEPLPELPLSAALDEQPRAELCAEAGQAARAVATLRPEQQRVLLLSTYHGLSHEEIAGETGLPLGTVKAHARRGLLKVRALLSGEPVAPIEEAT
jgi:RNA polymerase sigma-70 factor (ECF subfamily)